jgi:glycosyltransferase involved in cell wall biosynthesis
MSLPRVSVVVPAYNYGRYVAEALESVLTQDYPLELLSVIVVDDGSTDDTAAVVHGFAQRYPDTVRLVRQPNSGPEATVNRGLAEADGELLALLDADDAWLPGKLRAQVQMLQADPALGLVFGDSVPVDGEGAPHDRPTILHWMRDNHPVPRRAAARILFSNEALASTILMRRELARPVPGEIPIADWWLTLQAALASEIDWVREPVMRYRMHTTNRGSGRHAGVGASANPRVFLRDMIFKLRVLRMIDLTVFTPPELSYIWAGVEDTALQALSAAGTYYLDLTGQVELDDARAAALVELADAEADPRTAARLLFESLVWNPYGLGIRSRLDAVAGQNLA